MAFYQLSRFHDDFAKGWMRVDGQSDIFERSAHFNCQTQLSNQVGSFQTYDLRAQDEVVLAVSYNLDEAFRSVQETARPLPANGNLPAFTL